MPENGGSAEDDPDGPDTPAGPDDPDGPNEPGGPDGPDTPDGQDASDDPDGPDCPDGPDIPDDPGDPPKLHCTRCDRTWSLGYELDELRVGNRAVERFALDHYRHTGHYPDDVTPWIADCRVCPETERFLSEGPARRFARTHSRHTGHDLTIESPDDGSETVTGPE